MNIKQYVILALVVVLFGGCYPDSKIYPEETDTVFTSFDPNANFVNLKYYQIVDSVLRIDENGEPFFVVGQYDQLILDRVDKNLSARGFVNVKDVNSAADISIVVSDLSSVSISYYWNYIPYGYYYPTMNDYPIGEDDVLYSAYYFGEIPTSTIVFAKSNIMIDMIDSGFENSQETVTIYWRGITTGIYDYDMSARLIRNIDQIFYQSPYLKPFAL